MVLSVLRLPTPQARKIAAIVMTMVGSKSQVKATPDQASRMYIERAIAIAEKYPSVLATMTQAMRLCSPTTSIRQVVSVARSVFQFQN